ncbi:MAG: LysM peptidoglycan-binding domain-containing protein, partial [Chloroflexi bacterium]
MKNRLDRNPFLILGLLWLLVAMGCTRTAQGAQPWRAASNGQPSSGGSENSPTQTPGAPTKRPPGVPIQSPTPDQPKVLPTALQEPQQYIVQPSDTLGQIAKRYGVSLDSLIQENNIANANHLEVGQLLTIPVADALPPGPDFKVIPDSELVYGPGSADFNMSGFIQQKNGYLSHYQEVIDNRPYDGAGVVLRVAQDYSVNPRLLLAVLEYQSGWVTNATPTEENITYPIRYFDVSRKGLYHQLAWAANNLNRGYYLWRVNGISRWVLHDESVIPVAPTINAGTAGVQNFFSMLFGQADWEQAVTDQGLFATYNRLFGYPFDYAVEPILPPDLKQPKMQLPFGKDEAWSFTGGPHGGWADGSAWAAIDFAPPGEALGCVGNSAWEVAVADGLIVRSDLGAVVQDLDGDGSEQTGWVVLYMHVQTQDRVQLGEYLKAGDRIGHPSCEGGISTGTHLHLARRYNGEWISADSTLPFNLDGWISKGDGVEYNGFLIKDGVTVEAWEGRRSENAI